MALNRRVYTLGLSLVLSLVAGAIMLAPNMPMAGGQAQAQRRAVDDQFVVIAGQDNRLMVLKNDVIEGRLPSADIKLRALPECGNVKQMSGMFIYRGDASCGEAQSFTYCLISGKECLPAKVTLTQRQAATLIPRKAPIASIAMGPVTTVSGLEKQYDINSQDLEITNVRLGQGATATGVQVRLPSQMELAAVTDDFQIRFQRPVAPSNSAPVAGLFTLKAKAAPGLKLEKPVFVLASAEAQTLPGTDPTRLPQDNALSANLPAAHSRDLTNRLAGLDLNYQRPLDQSRLDQSPFGLACTTRFVAKPLDNALVELSLEAPCQPYARIEISHEKMTFTVRSSHSGALKIIVPAFAVDARFTARFDDGSKLNTRAIVPGLHEVERVGIQWSGNYNLNLHALEFGAPLGSAGDVWVENASRSGGFVLRLGDGDVTTPRFAEIYTRPLNKRTPKGVINLTVEAFSTEVNCNQSATLNSLRASGGKTIAASGFRFTLPECDATFASINLDSALRDVTIAAN